MKFKRWTINKIDERQAVMKIHFSREDLIQTVKDINLMIQLAPDNEEIEIGFVMNEFWDQFEVKPVMPKRGKNAPAES